MNLVDELPRLLRFGAVGLIATVTHITAYSTLVTFTTTNPLFSNVLAYCIALGVSFTGHQLWTFRHSHEVNSKLNLLMKFFAASLLGFLLNTSFVFLMVDLMQLPPLTAVAPMASLVPLITYWVMKNWVFAPN